MAASTKRFTLNSAAYQDISEGNELCSFRLTYRQQEASARVRVVLATSLPAADTQHYDLYEAQPAPGAETHAHFTRLDSVSRCYARAASDGAVVSLAVYRQ